MNILVVLAHPDPGSFNHAIAETVCRAVRRAGHRAVFHDLYAEQFDPRLPAAEIASGGRLPEPIERHCEDLREAGGIVIVHPNWWGQPPAILKGWIDRVVRPGVAYRFLEGDDGAGVPVGLLKAKVALVFNTSNTPDAREKAVFGDPLETLWKNCVFGLCGVVRVVRRSFGVIVTSSPGQRRAWLEEAVALTEKAFGAGEAAP